MKKFFGVLSSLSLLIFAVTTLSAQDAGTDPADPGIQADGNLVPGYTGEFPSEGVTIIYNDTAEGGVGTLALCTSLALNYSVNVDAGVPGPGSVTVQARSFVRDFQNPTYPCDVERVGARARFYSDNVLRGDTDMQNNYHTSDRTTTLMVSSNCGSVSLGRGNHEFVSLGQFYSYVTDNPRCARG
jgi:hypothetical protein